MNVYIMEKTKTDKNGNKKMYVIQYKSIVLDIIERIKTKHRIIKSMKMIDNNNFSSVGEKI